MEQQLQFKISAALKNIIGRDLINDDFIAVFELVKNSYDAHASNVDIIFDKTIDKFTKITIMDNGKGMNYDDLIKKWLFVAYSAKKEGTEEESYNYRDRIKVKRAYAGAKGIGRFSCDRLGTNLYLETIKDEPEAKVEVLVTDWEKFEGNLNNEFVNISVIHDTIYKSNFGKEKGTVLEITNLRSEWNREKFLKLKSALAKLVNPNTKSSEDSFRINLLVESEKKEDEKIKENGSKKKLSKEAIYKDVVNGIVENFIFETLDLKTTKITSEVSTKDKNIITTTLFEGGKVVYKIQEENLLPNLREINYTIYFLNQSAKSTFARRMGIAPVEYGHIFVYKNGLRIFPYGERGEDPLKMDNRKTQGTNRYIGTRDSIGYIDIHGENNELRETSSRGDGLIKTDTYNELYEWFYTTLKRLEKYIVEVSDWGKDLSEEDYINLDEHERVIALQNIVTKLSKSKNLISIEYADDLFQILESKQEGSARSVLSEIKRKVAEDNFDKQEILKGIEKAEKKISNLEKIKDEAENEAFEKLVENEELNRELSHEISKKLFDNSISNREKEDLLILQHQIVHTAGNINDCLDELISMVYNGIAKEKLIEEITNINLEVKKILSASRFVTNAGFSIESSEIEEDIVNFVYQYIVTNYIPVNTFIHKRRPINIFFDTPNNIYKKIKFRPLEVTVMLDNLFSNSRNARAKNIFIEWRKEIQNPLLSFKDDGDGIPSEIVSNIFDFGYTQTSGSGMGLYQVKETLKKLNATVKVNTDLVKGVEFIINF